MFDFVDSNGIDGMTNNRRRELTARFAEQQLVECWYSRGISKLAKGLNRCSANFRGAIFKCRDQVGGGIQTTDSSQLPRCCRALRWRIRATQLGGRLVEKSMIHEALSGAVLLGRVSTGERCQELRRNILTGDGIFGVNYASVVIAAGKKFVDFNLRAIELRWWVS